MLPTQPRAEPFHCVLIHTAIGCLDWPQTEVIRPPHQLLVEAGDLTVLVKPSPLAAGQAVDFLASRVIRTCDGRVPINGRPVRAESTRQTPCRPRGECHGDEWGSLWVSVCQQTRRARKCPRGNASKPEENRRWCLTRVSQHGRLNDEANEGDAICLRPLEPRLPSILPRSPIRAGSGRSYTCC
jgi:hypothetical protein